MRINILILLILPVQLFSQNTFVKQFGTSLKDVGREIHVIDDSTFILECYRIDEYNNYVESTYLYLINLDGDIIRENSFSFNLNKVFIKSSGEYVFIGDSFDGKLVIGELSQNLVVDTMVEYDFGSYEYSSVDAIISDSGFIITTGTLVDGSFKETVLHKINLNLDTTKSHTLDIFQTGNYANSEVSHRIFHVNDSSIYLIGYNAFIVRLNTNLDTFSVFDNQNTGILSILNFDICLHNDTLIVLSYGATGTGFVISEVSQDLDIISSKYIDLYPIWEYTPHKLLNVDDVFFSTGFIKSVNDSLQRQICISKLNNHFDTIWCRKFGGPFNDNSFDIILTSDSSLLVIGETQTGTYNNAVDVLLIKTNLDGDVIGVSAPQFKEKFKVNIYPNPVIESLSIEIPTISADKSYTIEIYSIDGRQKIAREFNGSSTTKQITVSELSSGVYTLVLREKNKIIGVGRFVKEE